MTLSGPAYEVHQFFTGHHLTLSVAESCTGGALSATLTALPGASNYFLGGIVAYTNALKAKILGVSPALIDQMGAVSGEVVAEMADGLLSLTGSDFALAVSGIAGPGGGTPKKPVGTIWCAVGRQGKKTEAWQLQLNGSREHIIRQSVDALLYRLLDVAQQTPN